MRSVTGTISPHANGGSCTEWPDTLSKAVAGIKNVDTIIGGHQPRATWKDLEEYQRFTKDLIAMVKEQMDKGKTADAAVAEINYSAKYPKYKTNWLKQAVAALYEELKKN